MSKHERLCRDDLHEKARQFVFSFYQNLRLGDMNRTVNAVCLALSEIAHEKEKLARRRAAPVAPRRGLTTTLNRSAYRKLIDEDLAWLRQQPRSLERDHIEQIITWSIKVLYDGLEPDAFKREDTRC